MIVTLQSKHYQWLPEIKSPWMIVWDWWVYTRILLYSLLLPLTCLFIYHTSRQHKVSCQTKQRNHPDHNLWHTSSCQISQSVTGDQHLSPAHTQRDRVPVCLIVGLTALPVQDTPCKHMFIVRQVHSESALSGSGLLACGAALQKKACSRLSLLLHIYNSFVRWTDSWWLSIFNLDHQILF